ncbi:hypothetical protein ACHAXN_005355 [Cyclotella atomus]
MPRSHRTYNRIAITQDTEDPIITNPSSPLNEPLSPSSSFDDDISHNLPPIYNEITITLLDGAQTKFTIAADPQWKVSQFKEASAIVTKVRPESQRLIHMGKLLMDSKTLEESGISQSDVIVHLFPKPNVVINSSNHGGTETEEDDQSTDQENTNNSGAGAHVPQIVLDADEAARRSQILILSSHEIFEAQHRVKIFSFLLMIITTMELLTLMTLYIGVDDDYPGSSGGMETPPGNPTDITPTNNNGMTIRTWQNSDYADALISGFGFYVSLLGIKATTENTLQLARRYLVCIVIAGIANNIYYYYRNLNEMKKTAEERNQNLDDASLYGGSFVGILLPLTVWTLCIVRAYQFQVLIREAEVEARERTGADGTLNNNDEERGVLSYGSRQDESVTSLAYNDLELQVEQGMSS